MTPPETLSPFPTGTQRAEWYKAIEPLHVPPKYRKCVACILHQYGICSPAELKDLLQLHRSPDGMQQEFRGFQEKDFPDYFRGVREKVDYLLELPALFPQSESPKTPDIPDYYLG